LVLVANVVFSAIGDGAAVRGGGVVLDLWIAFVRLRLWQKGDAAPQPP
jgi:hypothetical protein